MNTYIVSINSPGLGQYVLGFIVANNKKDAQEDVVKNMVSAGIPVHKIGQQVTDNTTLQIGIHTITIVPITLFGPEKASALIALL